ncbi:1015_t:CDS:2, partial [Gigaspora rosea]
QNKKFNKDILIFNNFGINEDAFDIYDPDSNYNILNDSISFTTATESLVSEANKKENNNNNEIGWEDLEYESLEVATIVIEATKDESLNHLLDNFDGQFSGVLNISTNHNSLWQNWLAPEKLIEKLLSTSHATLHVVFQFTLPIPLKSLKDVNTNEQTNSSIFYNDNIE